MVQGRAGGEGINVRGGRAGAAGGRGAGERVGVGAVGAVDGEPRAAVVPLRIAVRIRTRRRALPRALSRPIRPVCLVR